MLTGWIVQLGRDIDRSEMWRCFGQLADRYAHAYVERESSLEAADIAELNMRDVAKNEKLAEGYRREGVLIGRLFNGSGRAPEDFVQVFLRPEGSISCTFGKDVPGARRRKITEEFANALGGEVTRLEE